MRRSAFGLVVFGTLVCAAMAAASSDPAYQALRRAAPQGTGYAVQNFVLERDTFRFRFEKGVFQFLPPVAGRVTGAVFVGAGSWELRPATETERRHLALVTGDKALETLTDRFESLVLLFSDQTETEIRSHATEAAGTEPAARAWEAYRRSERRDFKSNLEIRILADLLAGTDPSDGVFLALLEGTRVPKALAAVDPNGLAWLLPGLAVGDEGTGLLVASETNGGLWYLSRRSGDRAPGAGRARFRAEHYEVDSRILDNTHLSGTTTIRFQALAPDRRVLPLHLTDRLRIQNAAVSSDGGTTWEPADFIQEKVDEDSEAALVLPHAVPPGEPWLLRLRYEGNDVLRGRGDGVYAVGARESWYPNLGTFRELSDFDLTYRVPKGNQIVSVGTRTDDRTEGDVQVSVWRAEHVRVAGFNYGKFRRLEKDDPDSGMKIEVFTNPGTPDLVRELSDALQGRSAATTAGLPSLHIDPGAIADDALADGLNAARVGTAYFGPLSQKRVAITQQSDWFFGQSWPSLVFLPYLAALDGTQRHELGLGGAKDFVDLVGPHEFAHQWWGHQVGWNTYHDTWLSEGFAEFTASLVMQRVLGVARVNDYWDKSRRAILEKPRTGSVVNAEAGPITLGPRLATRQSPDAYDVLVYEKGAYVLHMLQMLMWDPAARPPDAAFMALMKDFATSFAGKNPSTRDFQDVVERHMNVNMDLAGDHKMDWFFRQWLDGTEIPRYAAKIDIRAAGNDEYAVSGTVSQSDVSPGFRGFLPLYVEFGKEKRMRLAVVHLTGPESVPIDTKIHLPAKPERVVANAMHDVLARD
jgi:Peptidase family M1 domain